MIIVLVQKTKLEAEVRFAENQWRSLKLRGDERSKLGSGS